jgi:predicted TPR repeat methyltransferase
MNRTEKRRNKKHADKAAKASKPLKSASPVPTEQQQTLTIQQAIDLGLQHHSAGDLPKAESIYQQILQAEPNQPVVLRLLGTIALQVGKHEIAVDLIGKALAINPDDAEAHNNLGLVLHEQGELDDAVASYNKALVINSDYANAHNNLSNTLRSLGRYREAMAHLIKAHSLEPSEKYVHQLNSLQGITTKNAPREYVEELFEGYAHRFENHLLNQLGYSTPRLMKGIFSDLSLANAPFKTTVDMGCGTGLLGVEFRSMTNNLIGIDLSKKMIEQAEGKQLYDQLLIDDLVSGLSGFDRKVNLFLSADVFIYVGNLRATFEAVRKAATSDAVFVFSVEDHEGAEPFILQKTARYAHSKNYIGSLASQFEFAVLHSQQTTIRKGEQGWINGTIYVLKLQSSNSPILPCSL